jgi:hypothetical protein
MELIFTASLWRWQGKGAWYFTTVPIEQSEILRELAPLIGKGWGSIPVVVTIESSSWKTSVFFDSKSKCYLLPIKAEIRKREKLVEASLVKIKLNVGQSSLD